MDHMKEHSTKMQCQYCNKTFPTRALLEEHESSHVEFTCYICYQVFRSLPAFQEHQKTHPTTTSTYRHVVTQLEGPAEVSLAETYTSQPEASASVPLAETHEARKRSGELQNASTSQPEAPAPASLAEAPVMEEHKSCRMEYICNMCDQVFRSDQAFLEHQKTHPRETSTFIPVGTLSVVSRNAKLKSKNASTSQPEASATIYLARTHMTRKRSSELQNASSSQPEAPAAGSSAAPAAVSFDESKRIINELNKISTSQPEAPELSSAEIYRTMNISAPAAVSLAETYASQPEASAAVYLAGTYGARNELENIAAVSLAETYASQPEASAAVYLTGTYGARNELENIATSHPEALVALSFDEVNRLLNELNDFPTSQPEASAAVYLAETYGARNESEYIVTSQPEAPELSSAKIHRTMNISASAAVSLAETYTSQPEASEAVYLAETCGSRDELEYIATSQPEAPELSSPEIHGIMNIAASAAVSLAETYTSQPEASAAVSLAETYTSHPEAPATVSFDGIHPINTSDGLQNASTSLPVAPALEFLQKYCGTMTMSNAPQNAPTSQPEAPPAESLAETYRASNRIVLHPPGRSTSTSRSSRNINETNSTYSTSVGANLTLAKLLDAPTGENRYETAYTAACRNSNEREEITLQNLLGSPRKRNRYERENTSTHGTFSNETGNSPLPGTDSNENRDQAFNIFKSPRKRKL